MTSAARTSPPTITTVEGAVHHSGNGTQSTARQAPAGTATSRPLNPKLIWLYALLVAWNVLTKGSVSIVYIGAAAQGLRYILSDMGMRLYRLPGLAFLEHYEATYRLDLAHLFIAIPLICCWLSWHWLLMLYLRPEAFAQRFRRWNLDRIKRLIVTMGTVVIIGDALLFLAAFTHAGWGSTRSTGALIPAVLATLVYATVIAFVTFVSLSISDAIEVLKHKEN